MSTKLDEQTLELPLLLPRGAQCAGCVDEVGRELLRLDGVDAVEADLPRGLLTVRHRPGAPTHPELVRVARHVGSQAHCAAHCPVEVHDHEPVSLNPPEEAKRREQRVLHVTGMDCADCAVKLGTAVGRESGVHDAFVNFGAATLRVDFDPASTSVDRITTAVRRAGYDTVERRAAVAPSAAPRRRSFWREDPRARLILVSGAFVVAGFIAEVAAPAASPWLFVAAMVSGGAFVARAAFFSLRARQVDMNVLMSLAAIGAAAIGQWSEAALVTFLFGLGTVLQAATLERTRRAITGLMELAPPEATLLVGDREQTVPAAELAAGDVIVVRPGERLPVDGVVLSGIAAAGEAAVTGEPMPVTKGPGDGLFAGSIIEGGTLTVRTTSGVADNTIAKIVHLVEEAQASRAPAQTLVDRFAARYTPAVVALAAAVAFIPPLLGASFDTWFYRGLALLIISCPCALVISTPVSILAALGNATRHGILVKGGAFLEQAADMRVMAFDKTGTLTVGRPIVSDIVPLDGASADELLRIAVACERQSEHPLARAIVAAAEAHEHEAAVGHDVAAAEAYEHEAAVADHRSDVVAARADESCDCCDDEGGEADACDCCADDGHGAHGHGQREHATVTRFRSIAGLGVRAEVEGRDCFVGRPELLGAPHAGLEQALERLEAEGKTVVAVGAGGEALGVIAVSDPLRDVARDAVAGLRDAGVAHVALLTGDNPATAAAIAGQAGVDEVRAGLLPADKVAAVEDLRRRHGQVAMVGDGVNDAPALAAADLGIAMGAAGTDVALETADIALMGDDLETLPRLLRLSRRTGRVIRENLAFSIAIKAVFLVLAPLGLTTLWLAVFADMGTSLLVTANGLRLHRDGRE